jgi:hypothetical protein
LPGQFRLVPPELFWVTPPGRIKLPDLFGQVEQPPGRATVAEGRVRALIPGPPGLSRARQQKAGQCPAFMFNRSG